MSIWQYIKADPFFAKYLPKIKSHKFKIRGFNSRDNKTEFTKEEKEKIKAAIKKMVNENKV